MYTQKPLPYSYEALEPFIDTHTLALHYRKHEANYLNKLNVLLGKNNYKDQYPLEELPKHINEFPVIDREDIAFNLGGVLNHDVYFRSMSPTIYMPEGQLLSEIQKQYGKYETFKKEFIEAANRMKGSGYTFLVMDKNKKLGIINMFNQETPYQYDLIPLLALDLWEHAYYINYENKRDLYIQSFFDIISFEQANKIFNI